MKVDALIFTLIFTSTLVLAPAEVAAAPPNVVLILADDLGFSDTAPYGSEVSTPAISSLAREGIRFANYHTSASCAPTRGMLLTGVDSHRNGVPNIPEAIPPAQAEHPHYRGTLNHQVVAMADTGSDNWEQKPYLPIYDKANWFADDEEMTLPDDYYSSKFLIDKTIEFIESGRADGGPFFAYIPFMAVHIPVQAPQEFTDHYLGRYDGGWSELRARRLRATVALGMVPAGTEMITPSTTADWSALSAEGQRYAAKQMAVYAGMIEAMDHHIGRLIAYLEQTGQYDNTLFVFVSDNGSEASQILGVPGSFLFEMWLSRNGYNTDYETLGTRGSFMHIGPSFASAAASPLAYYKFFARERGMRVPLIVAGPGVAATARGSVTNAFAYVTDLAPTLLEAAGVAPPAGSYRGREVEAMTGTSLLPLLAGRAQWVHGPDEPIGYELAGNAALFRGDYKIVKDRGPVGDDTWHLFDIVADPGESRDLKEEMPERFAAMISEYAAYAVEYDVLPVPEGYDQRRQVALNGLRRRVGVAPVLALAAALALLGWLAWRRIFRRRMRRAR